MTLQSKMTERFTVHATQDVRAEDKVSITFTEKLREDSSSSTTIRVPKTLIRSLIDQLIDLYEDLNLAEKAAKVPKNKDDPSAPFRYARECQTCRHEEMCSVDHPVLKHCSDHNQLWRYPLPDRVD